MEEFRNIQTNEGCGGIAMDDEEDGAPGAVDLPDDPHEAFGIGYSAALGEVLVAIQGLMPTQDDGEMMLGPMPDDEEGIVDVEIGEMEEGARRYKRGDKRGYSS